MSRLTEKASLYAYRAGWTIVRRLPARAAYGTFRAIADIMWWRRRASVRQLEANLARVAGPLDEKMLRDLSRAGVRSYTRYWCDAFRLPDWSREEIIRRVRPVHAERLSDPIAAGRGVVVALPHMGNWDLAGAWACLTVAPLMTVAERLKPEELYTTFLAFRQDLGMIVLPHRGGNGNNLDVLAEHLNGGGLVTLPADRDLSRRGVPVRVFGETTRMPAGPALLAMRTGAVLLPATLSYEDTEPHHRLVIRFHEPIEPTEGTDRLATTTQRLADAFAEGISDHPADWHMLQKLFLSDLSADDPRRLGTVTS